MDNFPKYYTLLFAATADALDHLEHQNYGLAKEALIQGQKLAEACYLADEEGEPIINSEKSKFIIDQLHSVFSDAEDPEAETQG